MDEDVHPLCEELRWIFFACAARQGDEIDMTRLRHRWHALALALLATGSAAEVAPPVEGTVVEIVDFMRFEPASLTVAAGTTVTWINNDGSNHIIQMRSGAKSPRMRHGASYSQRFDAPGEYPYICAIHGERMSGTIIVQAP
jgi:plastocyanin